MRSGHFFDAWDQPESKNWPRDVKYESVGPYGDQFREHFVQKTMIFDQNPTAPKKHNIIYPTPSKKRQQLIKSIIVSLFWHLDPIFS